MRKWLMKCALAIVAISTAAEISGRTEIFTSVRAEESANAGALAILRDEIDKRHEDTVRAMLAANPKLAGQADAFGKTAVHYAAQGGDRKVLQAVLAVRPGVNGFDQNGRSPIFYACEFSKQDNLNMLIAAGAEINIADPNGVTPLLLCAQKGKPYMVRDLINARADVNAADKDGRTPLMLAAAAGNDDAVKFLLGGGAKIDATDAQGETALHYAARNDKTSVIKFFTSIINVKNNSDQTALNIAGIAGYSKFIQELLKYGATS